MGDKPRRVIVTRPAQDAAHWVDQLTSNGFDAQALPLIDIGPMTDSANVARLQDARGNLHEYAACMFVSGNAVQYFFQSKTAVGQSNRWLNATNNIAIGARSILPDKLRLLAPGPGTAAALLAVGIPAAQIDSPPAQAGQFDSEALWQVVGQRNWLDQRVLLLRGQTSDKADPAGSGREWLTQQFVAAGAHVESVSVYQRAAPQLTDIQRQLAKAAMEDGSVWLFSSSEALANLVRQRQCVGGVELNWQAARAVATHPRIAQAVRAAGWGVVRESRPTLPDIVQSLRSIEFDTHE